MGVFVAALAIFLWSPVHHLLDSRYLLLVSESLLERGGFALDRFLDPAVRDAVCAEAEGAENQLRCIDGRVYHYFPVGGAVLAVPFLAVARTFGVRPVDASGAWNLEGEMRLQRFIASVLMASFAVVILEIAAMLLPMPSTLALLIAMIVGTQVWSTASRGLWPQTPMILLVGLAVLELARAQVDRREPRPVWLATLLGCAFFTRPTAIIAAAAVALYLLPQRRKVWTRFAAVFAAWLAVFAGWSLSVFGTPLPPYYARGLESTHFAEAFAGNLVSPSRGLLVFLPQLLFLGYLLIRYPPRNQRPLAFLAGAVAITHLLVTSAYPHWWGGHSFGPRLLTDMLPWLALLAVIATDSWLHPRTHLRRPRTLRAEGIAAGCLVLAAVLIHAGGALSPRSEIWNSSPQDVDRVPARLWDWSDPQFLAFATDRPWDWSSVE